MQHSYAQHISELQLSSWLQTQWLHSQSGLDRAHPTSSKSQLQGQPDLFGDANSSTPDADHPLSIARNLPSDLDGSRGRFRRPATDSMLDAVNDYQAIRSWVQSKGRVQSIQRPTCNAGSDGGIGSLSSTQRAYLREAERLLLWATLERSKALSSLKHDDCIAYSIFLMNPVPAQRWCGNRSEKRWSAHWRPFEGPLSPSARRQALVILSNLFGFLRDKCYLCGNPMAGIRSARDGRPRIDVCRSFTQSQWQLILQQLAGMPVTPVQQRLCFALKFLYGTGVRLSELVNARLNDIEHVETDAYPMSQPQQIAWVLVVNGKGGQMRDVPIPHGLMGELRTYLQQRSLDCHPGAASNHGIPVIGHAGTGADKNIGSNSEYRASVALSASALYKSLKSFFESVAIALRHRGDEHAASKFDSASTHWMRHTHASHSIARGVPLEIAQQNLGHRSLATTTVYVHTERSRRVRAMEGFWNDASC